MMRLGRLVPLALVFVAAAAGAQGKPAAPAAPPAPPPQFKWTEGPSKVALSGELELNLPAEHVFLGMPQAGELMKRFGSFYNDNLLGVVASKNEADDWIVVIRYDAEGYIKDDEKIEADELLKAIREGTEEANKERVRQGFKALRIDGWSEPPAYRKDVHHMVWALLVSDDDGSSVNYNTRVLGRRGYVSINLVTNPKLLEQHRPNAAKLLAATQFKQGARYEDFDKKNDKVAEYGLTGLILGGAGLGAAKLVKLGFFAKFFKFFALLFAKGFKLIILAFAGLAAAIGKLFGKKSDDGPPPGDASPPVAGGSAPPPSSSDQGGGGPPPGDPSSTG